MVRNMGRTTRVERQVQKNMKRAFTLIELLTVIAITAILLTIIILPIMQSFNLTRAAQAYSDAQDKARILIEKIQREINNGVSVRDNSGLSGSVVLRVPSSPNGVFGPPVVVTLPYQKLDIVRPAEGEPGATPGEFFNPYIGRVDPTLKAPKGQTLLPVAAGFTIVRYFVGPRDPFQQYNNPYDGLLMQRGGGRDNLFVLYRAEVQPRIWDPVDGRYEVDTRFFDAEDPANPVTPILDDRFFFVPDLDNQGAQLAGAALADKQQRVRNWLARAVIQTEISRYDMIQPLYDRRTRIVPHDLRADASDFVGPALKDRPRLLPLIQFKPTRVNGEIAEGMMAVRLGDELDNALETGPDVFTTELAAWSGTTVRFYPSGWNRNDPNFDEYLVMRVDPADGHTKVFAYDPGSGTVDNVGGVAIFDVTEYNRVVSNPLPSDSGPFNAAVLPAAMGFQNLFVAMLPDTAQGKVTASFGIDTVRTLNLGSPLPGGATMNQPWVNTSEGPIAYGPLNDPNAAGPWTGATSLNNRFNRIWNDPAYAGLKPDKLHRFIDLRVTDQLDGSISPLNPTGGFGRAKIVPGSDIVIGPDQNPGPNYGQPVRYTRTTRTPGPNQYRINYVDQTEPDYSLYGLANPPAGYDGNDFVSAIFQPRFKAGYIQLNSDPNVPLPPGNIRVYYRFQFSGGISAGSIGGILAGGARQDAVAVDYDTRQLMSILLTIRNYPQANLPNPQSVTLSATAKVRNYLR